MKRLCYTLSSLALVAASPALAQTTAVEIWAEWQEQSALAGQNVSADVTQTDTGLLLSNFTAEIDDDVEDFVFLGQIDEVTLTENADGSVTITFSQPYTLTMTFDENPGGDPDGLSILFNHENMNIVASGTPDARSYIYNADEITATVGEITGNLDDAPEIDLDMTISDFYATYILTGPDYDNMRVSSDTTVAGMSLVLEIRGPASDPGVFKFGMQTGPWDGTAEGSFVSVAAMQENGGTWPTDADVDVDFTYESFALEMMFDSPEDAFSLAYSNDGGTFGVGLAPEALTYDIAATGASAMVTARDLPVPLNATTASSEISFVVPLSAGDAPQDAGLRLSLQDLVLGETAYMMFDPAGAIPRTPASLLFDATGQVQLFMDIISLNPETMTGPPGELRAISVSEMRLAVGGAELSGTADFSFAPGQVVPMPVGQADLQLSGGNALMEALVAGGMIPAAQSGMVMGMANVFARPGAAPDTLETTVEFGADGSITANGVPLQ